MAWAPPDPESGLVLQQILSRARERALNAFSEERRRIEIEQAAKGVLGGPVLTRCGKAAETAIQSFTAQVVPELLDVLDDLCAGPPTLDALDWARTTAQAEIDTLVAGLGGQIDGLKSGGGVKGAAKRLDPAGAAAKRDVDIEINRATIRSPPPRPAAPLAHPRAQLGLPGDTYSLLVSAQPSAWAGAPFFLDRDRFLEYTDQEVRKELAELDESALARLVRLPCVFAYEDIRQKDPLFGVVRRVVPRDRDVRVEYEIVSAGRFLSQRQFRGLGPELGIEEFEFHRTHWAVKEVNLARVLAAIGVTLPPPDAWRQPVNVATHQFDVALSFPGEVRAFVKEVADQLEDQLGADRYFYESRSDYRRAPARLQRGALRPARDEYRYWSGRGEER